MQTHGGRKSLKMPCSSSNSNNSGRNNKRVRSVPTLGISKNGLPNPQKWTQHFAEALLLLLLLSLLLLLLLAKRLKEGQSRPIELTAVANSHDKLIRREREKEEKN